MKIYKSKSYFLKNTTNILFLFFITIVFPVQGAQRDFFKENTTYSLDNPPSKQLQSTFLELDIKYPIKLQGNLATAYINFGSRLDEIVTNATLELSYMYSPILSPASSHVRILLNNHVLGYIAVEKDKGGIKQNLTFNLDPKFLSKFNTISFELVAHRDLNCVSEANSGLWFEIDNSSKLVTSAEPIPVKNDFIFFPKPFVDINDFGTIEVPFVYPETGIEDVLEASGIAASYFGTLTKWQELLFPVVINALPNKHAIVFATNKNRPDFLKNLPEVDKPTVQLISHPNNPFIKLLLVLGRDKQDLRVAIEGLTTGSSVLNGSYTQIEHPKEIAPRKPYDAVNWLQTEREIPLKELIQNKSELQVMGKTPPEISIHFNIAPDLFTWRSKGIPLNIGYRYSPANKVDDSQLSILVNDIFLKGYGLTEKGVGGGNEGDKIRIPLVDDLVFGNKNEVLIPGFRLGDKNKLEFQYRFNKPEGGNCTDLTPTYMYGEIDSDSTLDLRGFPHYMAMPDIKSFINLGFPFTRLADLSETGIYISDKPSTAEISVYLKLLGAMGSSTGITATKFTLFHKAPFDDIEDKDLLIISLIPEESMPKIEENWQSIILDAINKKITLPSPEYVEGNDNQIGAILGFESPWQSNRSAVAIVASDATELKNVTANILSNNVKLDGTASLFKGDDIVGLEDNKSYYIGQLPLYKLVWFHLSDSPILLGFLTLLMTGLIIFVVWRLLKYVAYVRLHNFDD